LVVVRRTKHFMAFSTVAREMFSHGTNVGLES
jgi:hypothetical protein